MSMHHANASLDGANQLEPSPSIWHPLGQCFSHAEATFRSGPTAGVHLEVHNRSSYTQCRMKDYIQPILTVQGDSQNNPCGNRDVTR